MTQPDDAQFDEALAKALELYDRGDSIPEIVERFPEAEEFLTLILRLRADGELIRPSPRLLERVVAALPEAQPVTDNAFSRSFYRGDRGRPPMFTRLMSQIHAMTWKNVMIPLGIVAVLVVVFGVSRMGLRQSALPDVSPSATDTGANAGAGAEMTAGEESGTQTMQASGSADIDATLAAFLNDAAAEQEAVVEGEDETALIKHDSQASSDLGLVYDEKDFQ
ncbi:MAG: hypothetical protein U1A16_03835 [Patescibacteria group bacterium]|nr:hypothetical protein [Patescibacteria group bacterium]